MAKKKYKKTGKGSARTKRATPNPQTQAAFQQLGKTIGNVFTGAVKQRADLVRATAAAQKELIEPKTLDVREPDEQYIVRISVVGGKPTAAEWTWYLNENELPRVVATMDFSRRKYQVRLETYLSRALRGTAEEAKKLAVALLSASDWETSWQTVLGPDTSAPSWDNRTRKSNPEKE